MADKTADKVPDEGVSLKDARPEVKTDDRTANLPPSTPASLRRLAEDLPENDAVQKAYKEAMTAEDPQKEAKAKAKVVDESPDASETPSGAALKKVVGVSNDTERGEKYLEHKTAKRWGYRYVDES
jgi:hypothetical protein